MPISSCPRRVSIDFTETRPRAEVNPGLHEIVDISLKEFKTTAQRITIIITPFTEESRLLERTYYKNKNQQRSSLFWRKVVEIRRLVLRILELNLEGLVEALRYSFYDPEKKDSKILRTSWTRIPNFSPLISISRWLVGIDHLLKQTNERFFSVFDALTRQLRTLSFAPLVLTVVSMLSRFSYLNCKLQDALKPLWQGLNRLTKGFYSEQLLGNNRLARWMESKPFDADISGQQHNTLQEMKLSQPSVPLTLNEDTGSRIVLHSHFAEDLASASVQLAPPPNQKLPELSDSFTPKMSTEIEILPQPCTKEVLSSVDKTTPGKKRKKKKKDEIDDIFAL